MTTRSAAIVRVAIETATDIGTVAVGRGDRLLAGIAMGERNRHAERALPAIEQALELAGVEREEIREVVVGGGPGSFTGVRVAAATAKGLVAGLDVPLVAYSSLLALAAAIPADRPVCALLDARRGEVYAGCWRVGAERIDTLLEPRVATVEDIIDATRDAAPLFVGDGVIHYRAALAAAAAAHADGAVPAYPDAAALLWLAARHPDMGRIAEAAQWEPSYVRASGAERRVAG